MIDEEIEGAIIGKCSKCKVNAACEDAPCPYAQEINDEEIMCDCCEDCRQQCADDI